MRAAAAFVVLVFVVGACSATPSGGPVGSEGTASSTSTTTATTNAVAEPTTPLFLGERGERWRAAWNSDDFDAMAEFFAEDSIFNGRSFAKVRAGVGEVYVDAYGWDEFFEDCVHHSGKHVTCEARWTSDLHRPAGVEVVVHREVFLDDDGLITSFNDHEDYQEVVGFHVAFHEWLATEHPEIEPLVYGWDEVAESEENIRAAIDVVEDFVAQSDTYPLGGPTVVADPVLSGSVEGVDVYNANQDQIELVAWALDRFASVGLAAPPVTHVTFPPTAACAEGFSGMSYHTDTDGHIDVCTSPTQLVAQQNGRVPLAPQRTILHELGHLWIAEHVGTASRRAFLDMLDLEAWSGVGWESNGSEQGAEILMWGLMDTQIEPRVPDTSCVDRADAFELLTGVRLSPGICG